MLQIGITHEQSRKVTPEMTAAAVSSGDLEVFATPEMILMAENTAMEAVRPYLEEGMTTVGTKLDISHLAATPVGMTVRCRVTLQEIDRRRLVFSVEVYDEAEKIGQGTHERFIVDAARFTAKAMAKSHIGR